MRDHHHPRNLRRSFGSQPVVCVGRPSWSEAGIAAQVIPAQSSRWTSRGQGEVDWRLGDLATWRRADVVVDDRRDSGPRTLLQPQLRRFVGIQDQFRGFRLKPCLQNTIGFPKICQPSKSLLQWHSLTSSFTRLIF